MRWPATPTAVDFGPAVADLGLTGPAAEAFVVDTADEWRALFVVG